MKILYRQPLLDSDAGSIFLSNIGIKQLYFKYLLSERDAENITTKRHHHTHYEIHIVKSGYTVYDVDNKTFGLCAGQFILLPPQVDHRVALRQPDTSTLSITFFTTPPSGMLSNIDSCKDGQITPDIQSSINLILDEYTHRQYASMQLMAASLAQILIRIWRICGVRESVAIEEPTEEDSRLVLAIQFIQDNIENDPTVSEVSAYCHLSARQMTRIFLYAKNITPSEYIRKERAKHIEFLLKTTNLSLKSISERMHFSSEYYFNTFFKQHAGMTPGEFQKMYKIVR